jgi:glycosyltransferase involved in cell wall biosynthesis
VTPLLHFCVSIPTYNRAHTLQRAIDSVLSQTYRHFELTVLDDGSTDETRQLMERYVNENRVRYIPFSQNRGAVMMDELGFQHACQAGDVWSRLGSDDWWEPRKLEADAEALADSAIEALYGPTAVVDGEQRTEYAEPHPDDPRDMLLGHSVFACSWANIAVRTSVLKRVQELHGNFCEPQRLRHVSDVVVASRIVRFADIVFRRGVDSAGIWTHGGASRTEPALVGAEVSQSWEIVRAETARWGFRHAT